MNESVIKNDWLAAIMAVSKLTIDKRFKHWARYVETCNMDADSLKMFEGDWIGPGTVQVPTGRHKIILVCSVYGTKKYHYPHFRLLIMKPDTTLGLVSIYSDARGRTNQEWAERLKPEICELLEMLKQRDQGILTPRDRVHLAAESFYSVVSQLPEDEQIEWYLWLLQGKDDQFLTKLVELKREVNNV